MGEFFNWDITSHLLKGLWKVGKMATKAVVSELSEPYEIDSTDNEAMTAIAKQLKNSNARGFILGDGVSKEESEDGHIMIVGGVGSGKSSCLAIPSLLSWNERVFAIDIKGELYAKTKHSPNRKIRVFNPADPLTLGYDPFYTLGYSFDKVEDSQLIAHALVPLPPKTDDPFWIQSAQNLFTGAILHFYEMGYSFVDTVTAILDTKITDLLEEIFTSEAESASRFVSGFMDMKPQVVSSILTVLANHIMIFATNKNIINALTRDDIITPSDLEYDFDVYICVPEHLLKQWKNLLALIVSQFLIHFEMRRDMEETPVLFLLDEFARLGKIEGIIDGLATLRSKKITIAIILQSLAQLDLHYGKEARQVIADTCQYKAILNITDVDSQEYFSKAVGTFDKIRTIKSQQYAPITKFKAGVSTTTMLEEKPIIKPHEFDTLEEVVLLTPYGAFKVGKKPYYR